LTFLKMRYHIILLDNLLYIEPLAKQIKRDIFTEQSQNSMQPS